MKKILSLLIMLFMGISMNAGTIVFGDLGLENGVQYSDPFDGGDFTVTFAGGGNDGKYYTTGSAIRVYGGGTMTIATKDNTKPITEIVVTYDGNNKPTNGDVVNVGTYTASTGTWVGSANSVVFTRPSGSGHWRVQKIEVTVGGEAPPVLETVETPVFSVEAGTYTTEKSVEISCATEGATIYYGFSNNTDDFEQYSSAILINETKTLYAYASKEGMNNSDLASAQYIINVPTEGDYNLITDINNLNAGDKVIIVNSEAFKAMSTTQNTNNRGAVTIEINENTATINNNVQVFTLEGNSNGWYFNTGNGYIYAASSTGNQLKTESEADDNAKANITFSSGNANIVFQGSNTRNVLQYNPNTQNNNPLFSCYGSASQQPVQIYKLNGTTTEVDTTHVQTIQELNTLVEENEQFVFDGNVTCIKQYGQYLYIGDNTGGALIFGGIDKQYETANMIPGGWTGKKVIYNKPTSSHPENIAFMEIVNVQGLQDSEQTLNIQPTEVDLSEENLSVYFAQFVVIRNARVTIDSSKDLNTADLLITVGENSIKGYCAKMGGVELPDLTDPNTVYDVYGIMDIHYDEVQILPMGFEDENGTVTDNIDVIAKGIKSVKYYDVRGIVSDTPFEGVNIVVKEYSDGTKKITKQIYKF